MTENIIKCSKDVKELIEKNNWKIFGVGGLPTTRSEIWSLVPEYEIICSNATGELESVEEKCKINVFNLEKKPGSKKPGDILQDKSAVAYIKTAGEGKKVAIYVMKPSKKIEDICNENGWRLIAGSASLFDKVDSKEFFLNLLSEIDSSRDSEIIKFSQLENKLEDLFKKFGRKIIIQTFVSAGGGGTFQVTENLAQNIIAEIEEFKIEKDPDLIITSFIEGLDVAATGCATKENGTLVSSPRIQFIGVPEAVSLKENSKHAFCGNDWNIPEEYSENLKKQVELFLKQTGDKLAEIGFRGIFGMDFIYNPKEGKLVPLEINPRLIGTYPTEIQVQKMVGEVPLIAFHLLEFLEIDYKIENKSVYLQDRKKFGGQLIIFNPWGKDVIFKENLKGGVYCIENGKSVFKRNGFEIEDILNSEEEFIITDGVPVKGKKYEKNKIILRIVFKRNSAKNGSSSKEVNDSMKNILKSIKEMLTQNI